MISRSRSYLQVSWTGLDYIAPYSLMLALGHIHQSLLFSISKHIFPRQALPTALLNYLQLSTLPESWNPLLKEYEFLQLLVGALFVLSSHICISLLCLSCFLDWYSYAFSGNNSVVSPLDWLSVQRSPVYPSSWTYTALYSTATHVHKALHHLSPTPTV